MKGRILVFVFLAMVFGCDADKREVNQKAQFLCENDFSEKIVLHVWPTDKKLEDYVIAPDIAAMKKANEATTGGLFGALMGGLIGSLKATHEAVVGTITCDIKNTDIQGDSAIVEFDAHGKRIAEMKENILPKLAELPDHNAKVAYLKPLLEAGEPQTETHILNFKRVGDTWLVDYGIAATLEKEAAEKAATEQKREQIDKLSKHATELAEQRQWKASLETLREIKALAPELKSIDESIAAAEERIKHTIGEQWFLQESTDAMTDQINTFVSLQSDEKSGGHGYNYVQLIVRCERGEIESYISFERMLDQDYRTNKTPLKIRFGSEEPIAMKVTTSTSRDATFMMPPFIDAVAAHPNTKLAVEFSPIGSGALVATFQTAGSDKAIARVRETCTK